MFFLIELLKNKKYRNTCVRHQKIDLVFYVTTDVYNTCEY